MPKKIKNQKPIVNIENIDENKLPTNENKNSKKSRRSNYFITINTNQKGFNKLSEEYEIFVEKFKKSLNEIYNNLENYVTIKEKNDSYDDNVRKIDIQSAVELGPKTNSIHAHINISFLHTTRLMLDFDKIKQHILSDLKIPNLYLNSKLYHSNTMSLKDYLLKQYEN